MRPFSILAAQLALLLTTAALAGNAFAEVEHIVIERREQIADGAHFGLAGAYEKLVGRAHFALDPEHAANRRITDIDRVPTSADGKVRFSADLYILKPTDSARGNGGVLFEVSNRGSKAVVRYFGRGAARTFDPTSREDLGDAFLLHRGFTVVWLGWQDDVPDRPELLRRDRVEITGEITGLARADHVFDAPAHVFELGHRNHRPYPGAGDAWDPRNVLTVRNSRLGERQVIPRVKWRFARQVEDGSLVPDRGAIYFKDGFEPGKIYEAVWVAGQPSVVGLGLAAVRDLVAHLKYDETSPVPASRVLGMGISQTGRFLRHFLYQGFNADIHGRRAFDGLLVHTAGAGRGSFNHRFAQPSRDAHPYSAFFYPTDIFPFTGAAQTDPETGVRDGLLLAHTGSAAMPKVFFTNTGYEYWGRGAALIHTSVDGNRDVEPGDDVRIYHLAGAQHFVDRFPPEARSTRHPANPNDFLFALRALLVALDAWVERGAEPPPSRFPRLDAGTLVAPEDLAFPAVPGVEAPRHAHAAYRADYGRRFAKVGVIDNQPPKLGKAFPVRVPQVDVDGNPRGGLLLPEVAVPVATYTPWNWRAKGIGAPGELADFRGAFLPFPRDAAAREALGDPRISLAERYGSREVYLGRYMRAAVELVGEGYLLAEDLPEIFERAEKLWELVSPLPQ